MNKMPNSAIAVPCQLEDSFFKQWFRFLQPIHNLTKREADVAATLVKHRYLLSKVIKDNDILDRVTMSEDTKRKVREECGITLQHFQVILGKLRKNKVLIGNRINLKFVPNLSEDMKCFQLMILFDLR